MARERAASHGLLNVAAMADFLQNGASKRLARNRVRKIVEDTAVFRTDDYYYITREQRSVKKNQAKKIEQIENAFLARMDR